MALLNLVPPALDLVADHRGLVDKKSAFGREREYGFFCTGNCREKLPTGKDADATGGCGFVGHLLFIG